MDNQASTTLAQALDPLPSDPLLGLSSLYRADPNPHKIDLGVGVYKDANDQAPVLDSVKRAEALLLTQETSKAYIDPAGDAEFIEAIETLLFGKMHHARTDNRIRTIQTPGGSSALRIAAEFINRCNPHATIWLSNPTWVNHFPLLNRSGLNTREYRYYDANSHTLDFDGMIDSLHQCKSGDVVLLHGCCHNPTGADLSIEQWQSIAELALQIGFTPLVDIAYQGIGQGLEEDAAGLRLLSASLPEVLITNSCSKNFAIYRERTGSFSIVAANPEQATTARTQALDIIRGYYFVPPTHGSYIVKTILTNPALSECWQKELKMISGRIRHMRHLLNTTLSQSDTDLRFSHLTQQQGMFSFLGMTPDQVQHLKQVYSIYMAASSRINLSGINPNNVDYLANSIFKTLTEIRTA